MSNYEALVNKIKNTYESGVTMDEAERLAAEFLGAMLSASEALKSSDLDARMRKSGTKALKASVYLREATKGDKKPTESMLSALVDSNTVVQEEQDAVDSAEATRDALERQYNIFREAHIYYRGISKGRFE